MKEILWWLFLYIHLPIAGVAYAGQVIWLITNLMRGTDIIRRTGQVTLIDGKRFTSEIKLSDHLIIGMSLGLIVLSFIWPLPLYWLLFDRPAFRLIDKA